jgi:cytochrome c biogenesis protein CcdA
MGKGFVADTNAHKMTFLATFLSIASLAFLDSLNPFSIAAMALVIIGQNSLSRGLVFITATFVTYFVGGMILLAGWTQALKSLLPLITPFVTPLVATVGWSLVALTALGTAIGLWRKSDKGAKGQNTNVGTNALFGVMAFAVVSTASDVPTAIPYFGAIPIIGATHASLLAQSAWLLLYNFIYVSPLLLLLWLRVFANAHFEPLQIKIAHAMNWIIRRLCPPLLVILAIWAVFKGYIAA